MVSLLTLNAKKPKRVSLVRSEPSGLQDIIILQCFYKDQTAMLEVSVLNLEPENLH